MELVPHLQKWFQINLVLILIKHNVISVHKVINKFEALLINLSLLILYTMLLFVCFGVHRATTHSDLIVRAVEKDIPYQIIHNASIVSTVGCCGLQLYHFGETVSIPFWTETWRPDSFVDKIESNLKNGLHTLCLLGTNFKKYIYFFNIYLLFNLFTFIFNYNCT